MDIRLTLMAERDVVVHPDDLSRAAGVELGPQGDGGDGGQEEDGPEEGHGSVELGMWE